VDDGSTPTYDNFTVEYAHFEGAGGVDSSLPPSMCTPVLEPPPTSAPRSLATTSAAMRSSPPPPQPVTPRTPASTATPPGTSTTTPACVEHNPVEFATPLSHDEECINAYHDGELLGIVQWRTFSATSRCRDWSLTIWRRSCILRVTTASLGLSRRLRDTRHSVPRCSQRWTQLRRTTPGSLLISLVVIARSPLSGCSS
jgi:hypothetical protein